MPRKNSVLRNSKAGVSQYSRTLRPLRGLKKTRLSSTNLNPKLLLIILGIAALIFWRFNSFFPIQTDGYVKAEGTLLEEPRVFGKWQYFDIDVYSVKINSETEFNYADNLKIEGKVVEGRFIEPNIEITGSSTWRKVLYSIRSNLKERIFANISEPQASLLAGIVIGAKEGLPQNFEESLRNTGTIHVVVVSGYNISVVAGLLMGLSRFIKRQFAIILALAAITFYTLLVGADPPAVRAAIMGAVAFGAVFLGRQRFSLYALGLAGFIMMMLNPIVVTDIGFQLSFLATVGIILFQSKILKFLQILPKPFNEDLATTLSAQSLVVPVLFYHFGSISAISPVANALILWTIPLVTIIGFVYLATSFIIPVVAALIAWILWALLSIFVFVVELFGKISIAHFEFESNQLLPLVVYYLGVILLVFYFKYGGVVGAKQKKN